MIYAEVKQDGVLHQVWRNIPDEEKFTPPLLAGSTLVSFPDGADVRPGMLWDGSQLIPPPPPPLSDIQARAKAEVIAFADEIASRPDVAGAYPQSEKEGWATKLAAAEAHLAGAASQMQTDMLTTEASIVGINVDQLAQSIVSKAAWLAQVNATISGMRQKAFAQIDAATDQAGVDAVLEQMKLDAEKALADLLAVKP